MRLRSEAQNGQYNLPYMKAQDYFNTDLSIFKNFNLGGEKKLQLRVNAYNAFNHPIASPDPGQNLTLRFTNGVLSDPELRQAARGQQVRPAHRPARLEVHLLVSGAGAAIPAPHPLFSFVRFVRQSALYPAHPLPRWAHNRPELPCHSS